MIKWPYSVSNEHLNNVFAILLVVIPWIRYGDHHFVWIWYILAAFYGFQLVIGLYQSVVQNEGHFSPVAGTLKNSGIYAIFLVANLPILNYLLFLNSRKTGAKKWHHLLLLLLVLFTAFIIYQNASRTALLCFAAYLGAILVFKRKAILQLLKIHFGYRVFAFLILAFVVISFIYGLNHFTSNKILSGYGRFLALLVTREQWDLNFWFGVGLGRFSWFYPQWQELFFRSHLLESELYFLSAGESYLIFNEYLLLFKEIGFLGLALFTAVIVNFFSIKSEPKKEFLFFVKSVVAILLVAGAFSYPFHVMPLLIIFILCIVSAFATVQFKIPVSFGRIARFQAAVSTMVLLALTVVLGFSLAGTYAVVRWQNLRNANTVYSKQTQAYDELWDRLKFDGKFLIEYGEILMQHPDNLPKAIAVLELSKSYFTSYRGIESTGVAYKRQHNLQKAIENYEFLSFYIPSKFKPKYELMKLYLAAGDTARAKTWGNLIVNMPVKLQSEEVDMIRRTATAVINDRHYNGR